MSKTKDYMQKQMEQMHEALLHFELPIFEDDIAEDEEEQLKNNYHCFIFETLDVNNNDDQKSVTQSVVIYYYSENRDDLDERTIDILLKLKGVVGFKFSRTTKQRLQKKDTGDFVDRIIFEYNRKIVEGDGI